MTTFDESNMTFSFADGTCYRIEKDPYIIRLNSVKSCECVSSINGDTVFIEAKNSAPKCIVCDTRHLSYKGTPLPENWSVKTNFDTYVEEISHKFQDSFFFLKASLDGWHGKERRGETQEYFKDIDPKHIRFVLIITTAEPSWLPDINDSLKFKMTHFLKAWNIPDSSIKVVNPERAKKILNIPVTPL